MTRERLRPRPSDPECLGVAPDALARILDPAKGDETGPDPGEVARLRLKLEHAKKLHLLQQRMAELM